ncbi:MAG: phage integrase N-terminal SAM-like domain-containing protein [Candidatus Eremiobacteraeota bacterium]|nr:phage integrase N-terminal SAM-like domain-containing protein [Candidatus Eremiobacteraeota bacterium]
MSLFEEFLAQYRHHSKSTRHLYRQWTERFAAYCAEQSIDPLQCTQDQVEAYFQELLWRPGLHGLLSAHTLYVARLTVSRFYKWAIWGGKLSQHPCRKTGPEPPRPPKMVLSQDQLLRLWNAPDLTQPMGLRDLLLLELIYELGWSLQQCICRGMEWDEDLKPVQATWRRYTERARPCLASPGTQTLLVTRFGGPFETVGGAAKVLQSYRKELGWPFRLTARVLHRTHDHLADEGVRRRLPLNP